MWPECVQWGVASVPASRGGHSLLMALGGRPRASEEQKRCKEELEQIGQRLEKQRGGVVCALCAAAEFIASGC